MAMRAKAGKRIRRWSVYVDQGFRRDIGEGPFPSERAALTFAGTEVGVPWSVRPTGARRRRSDPTWDPASPAQQRALARMAEEQRLVEEAQQQYRLAHPAAGFMDSGVYAAALRDKLVRERASLPDRFELVGSGMVAVREGAGGRSRSRRSRR